MHDPSTLIYSCRLFNLWHIDPERKGNDDSCGWFMRSHHGDQKKLEKIIKEFEFDWDRVFTTSKEDHDDEDGKFVANTYHQGYFAPNGEPVLSVHGIVLNLFFIAAGVHFDGDRLNKAKKFCQKHLFEILLFAENPTDSLSDGITRKFEDGCGVMQTPQKRTDRIRGVASAIYGWILRKERPWYKHPKWHIHHWRLQIHVWNNFNRWAFSRCCKCGGRFKWGYCPVTANWNSRGPRFLKGETDVYHGNCDNPGDNLAVGLTSGKPPH